MKNLHRKLKSCPAAFKLWCVTLYRKRNYHFGRNRAAFWVFVGVFCILQLRLIYVFFLYDFSISGSGFYGNTEDLKISRGDIVDRNGVLLARNIISSDLYVRPNKMYDIDGDLKKIVQIFPGFEKKLDKLREAIYAKKNDPKSLVLIKQNIFAVEREKVMDFGIVGVEFERNQRRIYPHNNIASHVVGFLSVDGDAVSGIEKSFDSQLRDGNKIQLSIDINLQSIVRGVMAKAVKDYSAKSATGIIMKVRTGEVIAAVSLPDFNPNNLREYGNNDLFNRFSYGRYELGSVLKVFTAALAMEAGFSPNKNYDVFNEFRIGKFVIKDFRSIRKKYKDLSIKDIMRVSSNIGCARMMMEIGSEPQKMLFEKMGMFDKLDLEIPEAGGTTMPSQWKMTQAVTVSYGHGISLTPMHFVTGASAVINDGFLVRPTFLKLSNPADVKMGEQVISRRSSELVRNILREVVLGGTGRKGAAAKYDVGGKSGTAIQATIGGYNSNKVIVSFFAAVPISAPEYIFYITVEEPIVTTANQTVVTGGGVVAPIIGQIIALSGPMLAIPILDSVTQKS